MKTTVQILEEARALIDTPEKWCRAAYASDRPGRVAPDEIEHAYSPMEPGATCFCMLGAVARADKCDASPHFGSREAYLAVRKLENACGGPVSRFNDRPSTTHADVMAVFDEAINRAKGKGTV